MYIADDNDFRFNIAFKGKDSRSYRVGKVLSKLGRKKSVLIVAAVAEYLDNHQDEDTLILKDVGTSVLTRDEVKNMIEEAVMQHLSSGALQNPAADTSPAQKTNTTQAEKPKRLVWNEQNNAPQSFAADNDDMDISAGVQTMLDNLSIF